MADDDFDDVVDNVKRGSTWMRIVFMVGFCVVLYVVSVVIWFLTAGQALFSIFTGSDNRNLRLLGSSLAVYVNQILNFITYNAEFRPFPFNPFPEPVESDFTDRQGDDPEAGEWQEATKPGKRTGEGSGERTGSDPDSDQSPAPRSGGQFDDLAFLAREQGADEEEAPGDSPTGVVAGSDADQGEDVGADQVDGSGSTQSDEPEPGNDEDIEELLESVLEEKRESGLNSEDPDNDSSKNKEPD